MNITNEEIETEPLTPKQDLFCVYYTKKGDTFANATLSYALAYQYELDTLSKECQKDENNNSIKGTSEFDKVVQNCASAGSRMLRLFKIGNRIKDLMAENFDDDKLFDGILAEIAVAGKDTDRIQALKHRNELKARLTRKLDITSAGRPLAAMSDEELHKLAGDE